MTALPDAADILVARAQQEARELQMVRTYLRDERVSTVAGRAMCDRLDQLLDKGDRDLARVTAGFDGHAAAWDRLERARADGVRVKRESLALVMGALFRDASFDGGVGDAADRLFRGLSERTGLDNRVVAAVGENESLDRTLELARLRFSDTTVWGLPILAHELGHYVARVLPHADPELRGQVWPLAELLSEEADADADVMAEGDDEARRRLRPRAAAHLAEIFADVYATYAMGASHPLAAIVLRARVGQDAIDGVAADTDTHPSWVRRVATMCAALRATTTATGERVHRLVAERQVEPLWERVAGADAGRDPLIGHAGPQARRIVDALIEHAPQRLRRGQGGQSQGPVLRAMLGAPGAFDPSAAPEGSSVPQVLDAAWQWRLDNWAADEADLLRVSRRALQLCTVVDP